MKKEILLTEKSIIRELVLSHLYLTLFGVLSLNILGSVYKISDLIMDVDFNEIIFSFNNGYYTINDQEIGIPIFLNIILALISWRILLWHSLKIFTENDTDIKIKSKTNFLRKFVHFFF